MFWGVFISVAICVKKLFVIIIQLHSCCANSFSCEDEIQWELIMDAGGGWCLCISDLSVVVKKYVTCCTKARHIFLPTNFSLKCPENDTWGLLLLESVGNREGAQCGKISKLGSIYELQVQKGEWRGTWFERRLLWVVIVACHVLTHGRWRR